MDSYRHDPELMKVIIVEVTRAANSFGQTHLAQIRQAYELIAEIVTAAQAEGTFKAEIDARFAAMSFYGAIEQMLTGWIFGLLPLRRISTGAPSGWWWRPCAGVWRPSRR